MHKIFLLILFLPFFSQSQVKKKITRKKKAPVVGLVKPYKGWSPKTQKGKKVLPATTEDEIGPPTDMVAPVESSIADYKYKTEQPFSASSYVEALKRASDQYLGLVLFMPNAFDSIGMVIGNTVFSDSTDKADYLNSMIDATNSYNKLKYIFYQPNGKELDSQKIKLPMLYPAYLFLDNHGNLIGGAEGLRVSADRVSLQFNNLMSTILRGDLDTLQEKYRNGSIDSIGFVKLILAKKKLYDIGYTDAGVTYTSAYDLLEAFLKKYPSSENENKELAHFVRYIYSSTSYLGDTTRVNILNFLINNYGAFSDSSFEVYKLISDGITILFENAMGCNCDGQSMNVSEINSAFYFHRKFIQRIRNIQLLNEGNKLMLHYYDFLTKKYPSNNVMDDTYWFFDRQVQVGKGMVTVKANLRELADRGISESEKTYFKNQYVEYGDFETKFFNDLGLALNNISWEMFKIDSTNAYLPKLLEWSKASLEIEKSNPFYLDTYAQLLYTKGDKKEAIENEAKAVRVMQTDKNYTSLGKIMSGMTTVLNKMRAGKRVPRKDYAQ